jgi:hypothetical protein
VSNKLRIPGLHTILVKACKQKLSVENGIDFLSPQSDLDHRTSTVGLSVESDGMPGSLAVFGIAPRKYSAYEALPFAQTETLRSAASAFPGVPVGPTTAMASKHFIPELGIANFGSESAKVQVFYSSTAFSGEGPQEITSISVPPLTSATIAIPDLPADPDMQNSFSVVTDAENGQLMSTLHSRSADNQQLIDLPNQDQKKAANGGQHPWIVDKDTASYLLLYNADKSSRSVGVSLHMASGQTASKDVLLEANRTLAISIKQLIGQLKLDDINTDSATASPSERGTITWVSLASRAIFGRLLQVDGKLQAAKNFSCFVEYIACGATTIPETITLAAGGSAQTVYGYAQICPSIGQCTCDGGTACTGQTAQVTNNYWAVANTSIASISGSIYDSQASVAPGSVGQTTLFLGVTDDTTQQCSAAVNQELDTVCAVPTNFRQTSATCNPSTGVLQFTYDWDSSTGNKADLASCTIHEIVRYDNNGVPPSPPFPQFQFPNPTIIPPGQPGNGNSTSVDTHSPPSGSFVQPYSESTFSASQDYEYICPCQGTADWTLFTGFRGIPIIRQVTNPSGTWLYQITKSGQSCSIALPQ